MLMNFRSVYRLSEEWPRRYAFFLFPVLLLLVVAQSYFSPLAVFSVVLTLFFLLMSFLRPLSALAFLSLYLPFESFLLKFTPNEIYVFARFFSEGLIYILALVIVIRLVQGRIRLHQSPIDLPIILFLVVLFSGALIHAVPASITFLCSR